MLVSLQQMTSSASSGNVSSGTNQGTIAKGNECNKNKQNETITDKLDLNSRKKKAKWFKAMAEGKIINLSNFPKWLLKMEKHFRVAGPGSSSRRGSCVYCSYCLYSTNDNSRTKLKCKEFVKWTHWICTVYQVELCKGHFDASHLELWNFEKIVRYPVLSTKM